MKYNLKREKQKSLKHFNEQNTVWGSCLLVFKFCKSLGQEDSTWTWNIPPSTLLAIRSTGVNTVNTTLALLSLRFSVEMIFHTYSQIQIYKHTFGKFQNERVQSAWECNWVTWLSLELGKTSAKKCGGNWEWGRERGRHVDGKTGICEDTNVCESLASCWDW